MTEPKDFEFAPDDRIGYLEQYVEMVMEVVLRVAEIPEVFFISDLSSVSDFVEDAQVPQVASELEVPVAPGDLIVDVAQRLKNKLS